MDLSLNSMSTVASPQPSDQLAEAVQIAVMKKAMDSEAAGTLTLLQSVTGAQPPAQSGTLGTQVNVLA